MERLPFKPEDMKGPSDDGSRIAKRAAAKADSQSDAPPAGSSARDGTLTVTQLAGAIDSALKAGVPARVRVIGEVSGFRDRTHWYFDLKDASAVVSCVVFQFAAKKVGFTPENGREVVVSGRIDFYAKAGKVSLIADKVEPIGAGALELAYRALVEELRGLGWFDVARKRRVPGFPRKVAVVTSRTAAALQDVLVTMKQRCPAVGVLLADVRVQGDGAAGEVAGAIRTLNARRDELGIDAILVTRGGGSMEDLWAFNERVVAQAIVESTLPVVAAIGHETDTTIAELVADERCSTPTQAATKLTPDRRALLREVDASERRVLLAVERRVEDLRDDSDRLAQRLAHATERRVSAARKRVDRAGLLLERLRPTELRSRLAARLAAAGKGLHAAMRGLIAGASARVDAIRIAEAAKGLVAERVASVDAVGRQLRAVGPISVLERGYSVTTLKDGTLVRGPGQVAPGKAILTRTAGGEFESQVVGGVRVRTLRRKDDEASPGLFG
ncbi:MAG: exodeoxyribonuclease VII large subunit [Phycisphaerales bacterium]|nr:exodeoxyribonuclease VII large subunit [Phycisphaerales bacterium]